jgi:hypothetical protein
MSAVENYIGYSNEQKIEIDSALDRLEIVENDITSVNDFFLINKQALEAADDDLESDITSLQSSFNDKFISLTNVDNSLYSLLSIKSENFNLSITSLVGVDLSLTSMLNENFSIFNEDVISMNTVDDSLYSIFDEKTLSINNAIVSLTGVDNIFDATINTTISTFNTKVTSLTNKDTALAGQIQGNYDWANGQVAALITADALLVAEDAKINQSITSLQGEYNAYVFANNNQENAINASISAKYTEFTTTRDSLFAIDTLFEQALNDKMDSLDIKITSLTSADTSLTNSIIANHTEFTTARDSLFEVDSNFRDELTETLHSINSVISVLNETDFNLNYAIESNYSIFDYIQKSLTSVDSVINEQLRVLDVNFGIDITSLNDIDSALNEKIDSNYSLFNVAKLQLEGVDGDLQEQLNTIMSNFNVDIISINAIDNSQNSMIDFLDAEIIDIKTDISVRVQNAINAKVAFGVFSTMESTLRSTDSDINTLLGQKVAASLQLELDNSQTSVINTKVDIATFNTKVSDLNDMNYTWEARFRAAEEFIRVMLATYTIKNPNDNTDYAFTGALQSINPGTPLIITGEKLAVNSTDWGVVLNLSEYGYNTFNGSIVATVGGVDYTLNKSNFNSTTRKYTLVVPNSRNGENWSGSIALPFNIIYKSYGGANIFTLPFTSTIFNSLPLFTVTEKIAIDSTKWGLVITLSEYGYNIFNGSITATIGGVVYSLIKTNFNATTRKATLVVNGSRDGDNWNSGVSLPFDLIYQTSTGANIYTFSFTSAAFGGLTLTS